jgi:hypothetical protein
MGLPRGIGNEGGGSEGQRAKGLTEHPHRSRWRRSQPSLSSPVHYIATALGERSSGSACGIEIARDRTSHVCTATAIASPSTAFRVAGFKGTPKQIGPAPDGSCRFEARGEKGCAGQG